MNPTVGCHYISPGLQLPLQPLRGLLPISLLGEQRHDGCEQLVELLGPTRQRRGCDLNPGPSAPESSTLTILGYRATLSCLLNPKPYILPASCRPGYASESGSINSSRLFPFFLLPFFMLRMAMGSG